MSLSILGEGKTMKFSCFGMLLLLGLLLFAAPASAQCSGTNTYTLRLWDPLGVNFKSSALQTINPVTAVDCSQSSNPSVTLGIYCQMVGRYNASIDCPGSTCTAGQSHVSVANTTVLTCHAAENKKFVLRNQSGDVVAAFDSKGYLYLRGFNYSSQGPLNPPKNSFIIRNNTGRVVAFIDSQGNINVTGRIFISQTAGDPPKNSFIVRNGTQRHVAYIDSQGSVNLTGKVYFNWTGTI
jgi:hypothetical protein